MKIALCGSLNFSEKMLKIKDELKDKGHEIILPSSIQKLGLKNHKDAENIKMDRKKYIEQIKPLYSKEHFKNIEKSDAILVVNEKKYRIQNYIGGATFSEIMLAFHYDKKIFFLNPIPKHEKFLFIIDELESVNPIILNGNLDLIK
jgi:diphthamide synthase subunit DPH2